MNKLLIISLLTSIFSSCSYDLAHNDKALFKVVNKTNYTIDSLFISNQKYDVASNNTTYLLGANETKEVEIDMSDTLADGSYSIQYKINGKGYYENFGYYTNGFQIEEVIKIQIIDLDSLMID